MSGRSEPTSFGTLRERLLRAGIAPRHVRRYLRELTEHLADLTAEQRTAGYDEENATIRARALLGDDAELAAAMEEQPGFRSIAARFPWLVFPLLPLPAVIIGLLLPTLLMMGLSKFYGFEFAAPDWYRLLAESLLGTARFVMMPLAMLLLTLLVWRQRLSILWLLPCLLILLPLITDAQVDFPTAAEMLRHKKTDFHVGIGWSWVWSTGGGLDLRWGLLPGKLGKELQAGIYSGLARQLLILLPPLVLLALRRRQRPMAKVPIPS